MFPQLCPYLTEHKNSVKRWLSLNIMSVCHKSIYPPIMIYKWNMQCRLEYPVCISGIKWDRYCCRHSCCQVLNSKRKMLYLFIFTSAIMNRYKFELCVCTWMMTFYSKKSSWKNMWTKRCIPPFFSKFEIAQVNLLVFWICSTLSTV